MLFILYQNQAIKPGFVSKSFEVAQWTARLFSKLAFELGTINLINSAWDWFIGENGGLNIIILGLKRHPLIRDDILSTLLLFSKFNFAEMFTT